MCIIDRGNRRWYGQRSAEIIDVMRRLMVGYQAEQIVVSEFDSHMVFHSSGSKSSFVTDNYIPPLFLIIYRDMLGRKYFSKHSVMKQSAGICVFMRFAKWSRSSWCSRRFRWFCSSKLITITILRVVLRIRRLYTL